MSRKVSFIPLEGPAGRMAQLGLLTGLPMSDLSPAERLELLLGQLRAHRKNVPRGQSVTQKASYDLVSEI